jgi:phosphoribosylglycinamide formyltransferase-1
MKRFVGEAIEPVTDTADTRRMTRGEPGLPRRFRWRGTEYEVARVLEHWRGTGACRHGSGERYVRKHWYRVRTTDGSEMKLYFERQARSGRERKVRWWLHTIVRGGACDG